LTVSRPATCFSIAASVDTHAHVFERGLPMPAARRYAPAHDATLAQYLQLLDWHGLAHGVLVQPSFLGTDNSYMLQALHAAGGRLRGVAVVDEEAGEPHLQALARAGVDGLRLNLIGLPLPDLASPGWARVLEQAWDLGWHVELHVEAGRLPAILPALLAAGCRVVVDHFGRPDAALGVDDPGFGFLLRQADSGQVWVKLSAPYRNAPAAGCAAAGRLAARRLLEAYTAERLLWGSDWPHTQHGAQASYSLAVQWLHGWLDDAAQLQAVLARTPRQLFQFQTQGDAP
jgi:predicted TIM-barrel fold metal-dependent hydrolase